MGEVFALPSFMMAPEGSRYHVTEVGIKIWYGTERPYIKAITLDERGRPTDRIYTDPWTKDRKPFTKGPKDQFVLKPGTPSARTWERGWADPSITSHPTMARCARVAFRLAAARARPP